MLDRRDTTCSVGRVPLEGSPALHLEPFRFLDDVLVCATVGPKRRFKIMVLIFVCELPLLAAARGLFFASTI